MALPASLSTCTITGTYVDLLGNPVRGSLVIEPQTIIKEKADNKIIMPVNINKVLDANGSFTTVLPVTSDTDVIPQPFIYTFVENFSGGRTFQIALPLSVAGTTQNLADLLPAVSAAESASYTTVDQYVSLLSRYTTAEGVRVIVVGADVYESNTISYATATATAADEIAQFTVRSMLMMGV
jgi:hypothetical protein